MRLRQRPAIAEALARLPEASERWRSLHTEYVTEMSIPVMAVSLPTAALLWALCETTAPGRLVDLGSGFSTFVLATWVAEHGGELLAVDDNPHWLEKTGEFLVAHDLPVPELCGPEVLGKLPAADLLFLDYAFPPERIGLLPAAAQCLRPGGAMVIDDVNQTPFGRQVRVAQLSYGIRVYSARRWTLDGFGRFAAVAVRR